VDVTDALAVMCIPPSRGFGLTRFRAV